MSIGEGARNLAKDENHDKKKKKTAEAVCMIMLLLIVLLESCFQYTIANE